MQAFWRDAALPFVESRRACDSRACYRAHHHPTFSLGAVDAGRSVLTGVAQGPVALGAGALVWVPAGRIHACNPLPEDAWSYQMLHLDAGWLAALRQESAEWAPAAPAAPEPLRVVRDAGAYRRFCALNALLFSAAPAADKEAALIEFVGDMDAVPGRRLAPSPVPESLVRQMGPALELLREGAAGRVSLAELARVSGLGRYRLIRAFRRMTGLTPHAWQLSQRVNLARDRIRDGEAIAKVAYALGFADQAHLQRVFKAHTGVTPGRYRA